MICRISTTTYIRGDKAVYTGNSEMLYGALAYEVVIMEGRRTGEKAHTYRRPGSEIKTRREEPK